MTTRESGHRPRPTPDFRTCLTVPLPVQDLRLDKAPLALPGVSAPVVAHGPPLLRLSCLTQVAAPPRGHVCCNYCSEGPPQGESGMSHACEGVACRPSCALGVAAQAASAYVVQCLDREASFTSATVCTHSSTPPTIETVCHPRNMGAVVIGNPPARRVNAESHCRLWQLTRLTFTGHLMAGFWHGPPPSPGSVMYRCVEDLSPCFPVSTAAASSSSSCLHALRKAITGSCF